jgi:hypothetical protein
MKEFRGWKLCRWERLTCFLWAASCYICVEQPLTGVYRKTAPPANPSLLPTQVNLQQPGLAFQTTEDTVCYTRLHQTLSLTGDGGERGEQRAANRPVEDGATPEQAWISNIHVVVVPVWAALRIVWDSYKYSLSFEEKFYFTPKPMGVGTHHPQPMKMNFLPLELSKTGQITPWNSFEKS